MDVNGEMRTFTCPHCPKSFTRKSAVQQHLLCHTGKAQFKCSKCSKEFVRKHDRDRHEKYQHEEKQFRCGGCAKEFARKDALQEHFRTEIGRGCPQSDHREKHEPPTERQCSSSSVCEESQPADINTGQVRGIQGPSSTAVCSNDGNGVSYREPTMTVASAASESFQGQQVLQNRSRVELQTTKSDSGLEAMLQSLNQAPRPPALCLACLRAFLNCKDLEEHFETHLLDDRRYAFPCWECGVGFETSNTFFAHWNQRETCGATIEVIIVECTVGAPVYSISQVTWGCGTSIGRHRALPEHLNISEPCWESLFAMEKRIMDSAQRHIDFRRDWEQRSLANTGPSSCLGSINYKPAIVLQSPSFDADAQIRNQPHICHTCSKSFRLKKDLARHMGIHQHRMFECSACGKGFSRRDNCGRHIQQSHLPDFDSTKVFI